MASAQVASGRSRVRMRSLKVGKSRGRPSSNVDNLGTQVKCLFGGGGSLRRIPAATSKRITPQNSPDSLGRAPNSTVFFDGLDHVVAAGGAEAALLADDGAERELIPPHAGNEHSGD